MVQDNHRGVNIMVKITMISGQEFYYDGTVVAFGGLVRSAHARGSATLEVNKDAGGSEKAYILLTNVESFE